MRAPDLYNAVTRRQAMLDVIARPPEAAAIKTRGPMDHLASALMEVEQRQSAT